jgi:hypothetical protein
MGMVSATLTIEAFFSDLQTRGKVLSATSSQTSLVTAAAAKFRNQDVTSTP